MNALKSILDAKLCKQEESWINTNCRTHWFQHQGPKPGFNTNFRANPDLKDMYGNTALMLATGKRAANVEVLLSDRGHEFLNMFNSLVMMSFSVSLRS